MFAPNWSAKAEYMYYDFGNTRFVTPGALVPFGNFRNDEHTLKARRQLSLQLRRPGGCALLIAFQFRTAEGRRSRRPFCFVRDFRFAENSVKFTGLAPKIAKNAPIFQTC